MTRKQRTLTLGGLLMLLSVCALLYLTQVEIPDTQKSIAQEEAEKSLVTAALEEVNEIEITRRGTPEFSIRRGKKGWNIVRPIDWPADDKRVEKVLRTFAELSFTKLLYNSLEEEAKLGLDNPYLVATFKTKGSEQTLRVAEKNKLVEQYAATLSGQEKIGLLDAETMELLNNDLPWFRERRAFPLDIREILCVELHEGSQTAYRLERDSLEEPFEISLPNGNKDRADQDRVRLNLVLITQRLRAQKFVTDSYQANQKSKDRFAKGALRLRVTTDQDFVALIGKQEEDSHLLWRQGSETLMSIDKRVVEDLVRPADHFRKRTLLQIKEDDVGAIAFSGPSKKAFTVQRLDKTWALKGSKKPLRDWKIDKILASFSRLKADRIEHADADSKMLRALGVEPPRFRLAFMDRQNQKIGEIRVGTRKNKNETYLAGPSGRVGTIRQERLLILPQQEADLYR